MMYVLNNLASQVTVGTMKIEEAQACFLNYCATNLDAFIVYYTSDMIIQGNIKAAYLVASKARSRNAAYIFMGNKDQNNQIINGPIMVITSIIKIVVASAAEAEVASLYHAAQEIAPLQVTSEELGHKQPPTLLRTNNNTASGIMNGTIKQRRIKAIDMGFYWLKDRVTQHMFKVYWASGKVNLVDYFSRYHPVIHVKKVRKLYLNEPDSPKTVSACNKILA